MVPDPSQMPIFMDDLPLKNCCFPQYVKISYQEEFIGASPKTGYIRVLWKELAMLEGKGNGFQ